MKTRVRDKALVGGRCFTQATNTAAKTTAPANRQPTLVCFMISRVHRAFGTMTAHRVSVELLQVNTGATFSRAPAKSIKRVNEKRRREGGAVSPPNGKNRTDRTDETDGGIGRWRVDKRLLYVIHSAAQDGAGDVGEVL